MADPLTPAGGEIRKLNTLRGLAALIVVFSHYSNYLYVFGDYFGEGGGQLGVMLFFVLSGFLMAWLYLPRPPNTTNLRAFAVARFARVIPLYLVVVALSYLSVVLGVDALYAIDGPRDLLAHLLLLRGESILWTIAPEVHFYLVFALLWWLSRGRARVFIAFALVLTALSIASGFPQFRGETLGMRWNVRLIGSLPWFFAGAALGLLYHRWRPPPRWQSGAFLLALLLLLPLYPKVYQALTGVEHAMWHSTGVWLGIVLVFALLTFAVPDDNRLLSNPIGDFLGRISYSLYLLHLPVLWLMFDFLKAAPLPLFPLFLAATLLLATLSYQLIERPTRAALRRFMPRPSNPDRAD